MRIDLGVGKLGVNMRIRDRCLYIEGTNHFLEWVHHIFPFAKWREIRWANQIVNFLIENEEEMPIDKITGHSVGGELACIVAIKYPRYFEMEADLYTYGAKRPPKPYHYVGGKHYRVKGDLVPSFPPWRPALNCAVLDYGKMGFVEAHGPRSYYEQMKRDGVR